MYHEVDWATMTGMFNLRDILELVDDGFNDGTFTQQQFVAQQHQLVLHVGFELGDQFNPLLPELVAQRFGEVAFVSDEFTEQAFDQLGHGLTVIDIAAGDTNGKQFPPVIDDEMEFEPEKPTHRGLATDSEASKNPMRLNTTIVAHA